MARIFDITFISFTSFVFVYWCLSGPNCPDLDMVDLPGLVSTHVR